MKEIEALLKKIDRAAKALRRYLDGRTFPDDITTVVMENIISLAQEALQELEKVKNKGQPAL